MPKELTVPKFFILLAINFDCPGEDVHQIRRASWGHRLGHHIVPKDAAMSSFPALNCSELLEGLEVGNNATLDI